MEKLPFYKNLLSYDIFSKVYLNNHILDYIIAILVFILATFILKIAIKITFSTVEKFTKSTKTNLDDKIFEYIKLRSGPVINPFIYLGAIYAAIKSLTLSKGFIQVLDQITLILVVILVARFVTDVLKYYVISKSKIDTNTGTPSGALYLLLPIMKIIIWIIAFLTIISNMGFDISSILAGIGIGGIAIALAAQSFLGDILSFISIVADKPFEIGDYIAINNIEGYVVKIGIKSVRIASIKGEEVVLPNAQITSSQLHNYRKMNKRRVDLTLQVTFDVPNEKLEEINNIIKDIVSNQEGAEFGRSHFAGFSEFGYIFKIVYYIIGNDYSTYMNIQQVVSLELRKALDDIKVKFAYPTQDVRVFNQTNQIKEI